MVLTMEFKCFIYYTESPVSRTGDIEAYVTDRFTEGLFLYNCNC